MIQGASMSESMSNVVPALLLHTPRTLWIKKHKPKKKRCQSDKDQFLPFKKLMVGIRNERSNLPSDEEVAKSAIQVIWIQTKLSLSVTQREKERFPDKNICSRYGLLKVISNRTFEAHMAYKDQRHKYYIHV